MQYVVYNAQKLRGDAHARPRTKTRIVLSIGLISYTMVNNTMTRHVPTPV